MDELNEHFSKYTSVGLNPPSRAVIAFADALTTAVAPVAIIAEMLGTDAAHALAKVRSEYAMKLTAEPLYHDECRRVLLSTGVSPCEVEQVTASLRAGRRLYHAQCGGGCCD